MSVQLNGGKDKVTKNEFWPLIAADMEMDSRKGFQLMLQYDEHLKMMHWYYTNLKKKRQEEPGLFTVEEGQSSTTEATPKECSKRTKREEDGHLPYKKRRVSAEYKMGQDQSKVTDSPVPDSKIEDSSSPPSMESLLAEATSFGNEDENASQEAKAQRALECPCIQNLRSGPCGSQFSEAFLCFMKSNAEEKGSDCVHPFVALQRCIQTNPNAFPNDVLENDEPEAQEKPPQNYKIIPPRWSVESPNPKPKL
ncbi:hypothetical protein E3N88_09071 [Mikania micrantha]|uniref:Mitochondrial intermembrane space import and assembly protein 40 homolog n=1 Tax=Mikania micrantha TaxID=192012 RepID=A0A5N6PL45_9ASTR|nr:hypothetical protein E3N88_09071 [Mikania micrantha]